MVLTASRPQTGIYCRIVKTREETEQFLGFLGISSDFSDSNSERPFGVTVGEYETIACTEDELFFYADLGEWLLAHLEDKDWHPLANLCDQFPIREVQLNEAIAPLLVQGKIESKEIAGYWKYRLAQSQPIEPALEPVTVQAEDKDPGVEIPAEPEPVDPIDSNWAIASEFEGETLVDLKDELKKLSLDEMRKILSRLDPKPITGSLNTTQTRSRLAKALLALKQTEAISSQVPQTSETEPDPIESDQISSPGEVVSPPEETPVTKNSETKAIEFRGYMIHPLCSLLPRMSQTEKNDIIQDMRDHGFSPDKRIVMFETDLGDGRKNYVLDGWNRLDCALQADVPPLFRTFDPATEGDPEIFVNRENINRRNLSLSERACYAASLIQYQKERMRVEGKRPKSAHGEGILSNKVAEEVKVSPRLVQQATHLLENDPEAFEKAKTGEAKVSTAYKQSRQSATEDTQNSAEYAKEKREQRETKTALIPGNCYLIMGGQKLGSINKQIAYLNSVEDDWAWVHVWGEIIKVPADCLKDYRANRRNESVDIPIDKYFQIMKFYGSLEDAIASITFPSNPDQYLVIDTGEQVSFLHQVPKGMLCESEDGTRSVYAIEDLKLVEKDDSEPE